MNRKVTDEQISEAFGRLGSTRKVGRELNVDHASISRRLKKIARQDPALHVAAAPPGFHLKGASTFRKVQLPDGSSAMQWVKTRADQVDPLEVLQAFREALSDEPLPAAKLVAAPTSALRADLCCVYPMGDPHLGMLSWGKETEQPFDLEIAERNILRAYEHLTALAPASETALVANMGDYFHADNMDAKTWRSGNRLDVDSRWAKVLRAGVRIQIAIVDIALRKHGRVHVTVRPGNHDDHSALMLAICLEHHYRDEPRVVIDTTPGMLYYHRFGSVLMGFTHGHTLKPAQLPGIMSTDRARDWGETLHRFWFTGHIHSENKREFPGCVWESVGTLAARDAYAHGAGYRSARNAFVDVMHRDHGRVARHQVGVDELSERQ